MYTQRTGSAERARCILNAWEHRDLASLEAELVLAHSDCAQAPGHDSEEQERLDLLDSIAEQLERGLPDVAGSPEICYRLLKHLALSGHHAAIRSKKLAVFPC
ncbi:MAG TPA: hypothetical protein VMT32_17850 [Bryobacteraceae bacterium]|nr:hypothetical protein [Bryobacteraceae bacterium]